MELRSRNEDQITESLDLDGLRRRASADHGFFPHEQADRLQYDVGDDFVAGVGSVDDFVVFGVNEQHHVFTIAGTGLSNSRFLVDVALDLDLVDIQVIHLSNAAMIGTIV